jgi:hypothetical protein
MQPTLARCRGGCNAASAQAGSCALALCERTRTGSNDHGEKSEEATTMLTLWKVPGAVIELMVGTMIVMVHLGLAGAYANRVLAPPRTTRTPGMFD